MSKRIFYCWAEMWPAAPPEWLLESTAAHGFGLAETSPVIERINSTMGGYGWLILRYPYHDVYEMVRPLYLECLETLKQEHNQIILFSSAWLRYIQQVDCMLLDTSLILHDERMPPNVRPYAQGRTRKNALYTAQETLGLSPTQILELPDHVSDEERARLSIEFLIAQRDRVLGGRVDEG